MKGTAMAKIKFNAKGFQDLGKKIQSDIDTQQRLNPVRESDSQAERERKIAQWIKDAGYGKK